MLLVLLLVMLVLVVAVVVLKYCRYDTTPPLSLSLCPSLSLLSSSGCESGRIHKQNQNEERKVMWTPAASYTQLHVIGALRLHVRSKFS